MKRFPLLPLLLAAAACAPMEWTKSDAGPAQMEADLKACRQLAWREAGWAPYGYWYGGIGPLGYYDPFAHRMYPYPYYTPFADPYGGRFLEEARLTDFCMRAKGYQLEPVKK
jgi:hypothetical protein